MMSDLQPDSTGYHPLPGRWDDWCLELPAQFYPQYYEGRETCATVDSDPSRADNPYPAGTWEAAAWGRGWNAYWNPLWDREEQTRRIDMTDRDYNAENEAIVTRLQDLQASIAYARDEPDLSPGEKYELEQILRGQYEETLAEGRKLWEEIRERFGPEVGLKDGALHVRA